MPLRDHYRPPLDNLRHWEALHGGWPMMIVASLRDKLPEGYFAGPRIQMALDLYEVNVYDERRHLGLVAAVEIVSPVTKGRPESRRAFVAKCAALLREQVSVVIVDLVTTTAGNLCSDLLDVIGHRDASCKTDLYTSACRTTRKNDAWRLEVWFEQLALGEPLATLPLWLADNLAIPLELEKSYEESCRILGIP